MRRYAENTQLILPDGKTVGQYMQPQIDIAYETGDMPKFLPMPKTEADAG